MDKVMLYACKPATGKNLFFFFATFTHHQVHQTLLYIQQIIATPTKRTIAMGERGFVGAQDIILKLCPSF